jgi:multicomponent Na+:H+ antiporter subunit C
MTAALAVGVGVLYSVGVYLLLQRSLTQIVMGLALIGHGANLLLLMVGGPAGRAPLVDDQATAAALEGMADPMPQALALTAIVISFGITAFLLVLAWRSWSTSGTDEVEDDLEDRLVAALEAGSTAGVDEVTEPLR